MRNLIVEFVREVLAERRRRRPGGPRTAMGAIRQLNPAEFSDRVRSAVSAAGGDVAAAAAAIDVAPRTLYHYLDTEPRLYNVATTEDLESEED